MPFVVLNYCLHIVEREFSRGKCYVFTLNPSKDFFLREKCHFYRGWQWTVIWIHSYFASKIDVGIIVDSVQLKLLHLSFLQ